MCCIVLNTVGQNVSRKLDKETISSLHVLNCNKCFGAKHIKKIRQESYIKPL